MSALRATPLRAPAAARPARCVRARTAFKDRSGTSPSRAPVTPPPVDGDAGVLPVDAGEGDAFAELVALNRKQSVNRPQKVGGEGLSVCRAGGHPTNAACRRQPLPSSPLLPRPKTCASSKTPPLKTASPLPPRSTRRWCTRARATCCG